MIVNLIAGILTGFIISIPPMGPIAFAMISRGFKNEVREGRAVAFGAAFMDFLYCLLAFGGISLIISLFPPAASEFYAKNNHIIEIALTFAGCAIVIIYGLKIMRSKISYDKLEAQESAKIKSARANTDKLNEKTKGVAKKLHVPSTKIPAIKIPEGKAAKAKTKEGRSNVIGLFFMGVLLCMSSITLPASWIALVGYLNGYNFLDTSFLGGLLFSVGAFIGTLGWFYTLLKLITSNKKRINPKTVNKLNVIAGVVLLLLGVFLFVKAAISVLSI
jgi:threonine/homoserine/homoserine lactone efflux protein